ncbi:MAG TPA: phosphate acetyltransferase [Anaerohalosphaeraceae bacterium]|nr:phosphate acetyltransferase [Anaerohalosphaeraceae bacterium]HOL88502.1 phosphate acetyltransferase [Anaerohalosphaeraceae bacterium]HPP56524.1 phosphate acetyltransferase [Anaerohalosphaeraceae bacterium]
MSFLEKILYQASQRQKTIVLAEGSDKRVLEAAKILTDKRIARIIVLGETDQVYRDLKALGAKTDEIRVIDPKTSEHRQRYAQCLYEIRKSKGLTLEDAERLVEDNIYFGTLMVKNGDADGLVGGAIHASADMIRPALQIIRPAEGFKTISSVFFMCRGEEIYLFADCGLVEYPTTAQLSDIAVSTAITAMQFGIEPKIAMLSYSTKGSAKSEGAMKVAMAAERTREKVGHLFGYGGKVVVDGELQFDAAFVPEVAALKCPDSPLKGRANVFIFPNLEAGNICYKAVQRLGNFEAYGPILQGLARPVNDLSRGCVPEDIVGTAAITALQAQ